MMSIAKAATMVSMTRVDMLPLANQPVRAARNKRASDVSSGGSETAAIVSPHRAQNAAIRQKLPDHLRAGAFVETVDRELGPVSALDPSWEGVAPLYSDFLRPRYDEADTLGVMMLAVDPFMWPMPSAWPSSCPSTARRTFVCEGPA